MRPVNDSGLDYIKIPVKEKSDADGEARTTLFGQLKPSKINNLGNAVCQL
tara:strand:- start:17 stop:166 length:150 start_codon:yes stop_codon:yes gene_type:complete